MTVISVRSLARDIPSFLEFKRAHGHPYRWGESTLRSFQRFAVGQQEGGKIELELVLHSWLSRKEGRKPVTVSNELGVIRQFCIFRRRSNPQCFVPDSEWSPQSTSSNFLPYIFSLEEVHMLLGAVDQLRGPNTWAPAIRLHLMILYCTGLRPGEAVRLELRDINFVDSSFTVRASKGKTRLVPFQSDLADEIRTYLRKRDRISKRGESRLLLRRDGQNLTVEAATHVVRRLLRQVGLKPKNGHAGPRPYDFRHTFAVHRLTQWYREGADIHALLPRLSAYMGHKNILGTEVYLTATPELMAIASERFESHFRGTRRTK